MKLRQYVAVAAVAFALAACSKNSGSSDGAVMKSEQQRKTAPAFALKDSTGASVSLADYKGKVVLLNFWATWCGPCKVEIPWFMEFEQKYKDRNFAVLGVSLDDDGWKSVRPYLAEHKINYRVVVGSDVVSEQYGGIDSLPTSFIIDREGRIAIQHVGLVDKADYQNDILKLLGSQEHGELLRTAPLDLAQLLRPVERP